MGLVNPTVFVQMSLIFGLVRLFHYRSGEDVENLVDALWMDVD